MAWVARRDPVATWLNWSRGPGTGGKWEADRVDLVPESGARICAKPLESVLEGSTVGLKGKEKERGKLAGQAAGARFWVRSLVPAAQGRK